MLRICCVFLETVVWIQLTSHDRSRCETRALVPTKFLQDFFLARGTFDRQSPSESKRQLRLEPLKGEGLFPFDEDTANQTETNPTVRLRVAGRYRVILIVSLSFQNYRTQPSAGVCGR